MWSIILIFAGVLLFAVSVAQSVMLITSYIVKQLLVKGAASGDLNARYADELSDADTHAWHMLYLTLAAAAGGLIVSGLVLTQFPFNDSVSNEGLIGWFVFALVALVAEIIWLVVMVLWLKRALSELSGVNYINRSADEARAAAKVKAEAEAAKAKEIADLQAAYDA